MAGSTRWLILIVASSLGCYTSRTTSLDDLDLFFRFEVDGVPIEYTSSADVFGVISYSVEGGADILNVVGWDSATRLRLRVRSLDETIGAGVYSVAQLENDSTLLVTIYYQDPEGIDYFAEPVVPEDATIEITNVGSRTIDGTFFGVVKAPDRPDIVITNGEFTVRREHDIDVE